MHRWMIHWLCWLGAAALLHASAEQGPSRYPYYDSAWARGLDLPSLRFEETARSEQEGIMILSGRFAAFDQPLAGPEGRLHAVRWRQRARLYLPPADGAAPSQGVLFNCHDVDPSRNPTHDRWGIGIARAYRIPVLIHGWEADVVQSLDGRSFHATQEIILQRLLQAKIRRAEDLPMDGRYGFNGSPLVKGDMVAITLLQRLAERERGWKIEEVGSLGISKEGGAHWILGAVDDRVAVLAPGGSYHQDFAELLRRYRADWNGEYPEHLGNAELFRTVFRLGDWMQRTEAGRKLDAAWNPSHFAGQIKARHLLVSGDLGQHDGPFPVLAENAFLHSLKHPSWRYVRVFDGDGVFFGPGAGEMGLSVFPHVADLLVTGSATPSPPEVSVREEGRRLQWVAQARFGAPHREILLLYAVSRDRRLRDPQSPWKQIPLLASGKTFESSWLEIPEGAAVTWMAVAREMVERPPIRFWRSAATLPREHFPLPEHQGKLPSWEEEGIAP